MLLARLALPLFLVAGCDPSSECAPVGDPAKSGVEVFTLAQDAVTPIDVPDGGDVPLVVPQQGGYVVYAGMRVEHLPFAACNVVVSGELLDPSTRAPVTNLDGRSASFVADPAHPGWFVPDRLASLSTIPNVPACPNALGAAIADRPAILHLVAAPAGDPAHGLVAERLVTPRCATGALHDFCECTCGADWKPGKCALQPVDGGTD